MACTELVLQPWDRLQAPKAWSIISALGALDHPRPRGAGGALASASSLISRPCSQQPPPGLPNPPASPFSSPRQPSCGGKLLSGPGSSRRFLPLVSTASVNAPCD